MNNKMIRVCPKRDAICPHGMECPYAVDRYTCKEEMKSLPWGVHRLRSMIGTDDCASAMPDGRWARAVPEPYYTAGYERLRATWWVLTGRAHAVVWPKAGELEDAMAAR